MRRLKIKRKNLCPFFEERKCGVCGSKIGIDELVCVKCGTFQPSLLGEILRETRAK